MRLAPAAHGGNRTGRVFTGDRSGDWLFAALHRAGFANHPTGARDDGLRLRDAYVAAVNRCAPPANKPTPDERDNCLPYLGRGAAAARTRGDRVLGLLRLGRLAAASATGLGSPPRAPLRPRRSGAVGRYELIARTTRSQQNTFTGKLTEPMLDDLFARPGSWLRTEPRASRPALVSKHRRSFRASEPSAS